MKDWRVVAGVVGVMFALIVLAALFGMLFASRPSRRDKKEDETGTVDEII